MPVPYHLISRRNITLEEFNGFLQRCNGILDQGLSFSGRISDGEKHVWISLANEELKSYAPDEQRQLFELLRGQPEICILLDVYKRQGMANAPRYPKHDYWDGSFTPRSGTSNCHILWCCIE